MEEGTTVCPTVSPRPSSNKVIGVVCSGNLAVHRDQIRMYLERGIAQHPGAVWVCCEKKSDVMTRDLFLQLGVDPVVLPLNQHWKKPNTRKVWRDGELMRLCDSTVVFVQRGNRTSPWVARYEYTGCRKDCTFPHKRLRQNLYLVEVGE